MTERYIERSFPIVQLNPLSVRERNAFKPVYKMHKWFARRSPSIFRAILLASVLPYEDEDGQPIDLMAEFYKGHGDDPRFRGPHGEPWKVLDPFMGGGTTIVEGCRLGLDMTGLDVNPIAWFIVKGETTPVDPDALQAAYERVAGKVKDDLLGMYKTRCPVSGEDDADIIYGFWVKQGICVDPACGAVTDLFKSWEVARKRGDATISYLEARCPHCQDTFDWELNRCTVTAGGPQTLGDEPAGKKRPVDTPFAFGLAEDGVTCPSCAGHVRRQDVGNQKARRKKVPLHVLLDPSTGALFEVRGQLRAAETAPISGHTFDPSAGPTSRGKFSCGACGRRQDIVESARAHGKPLPFRYYAHYALASRAGLDDQKADQLGLPTNNGKFFAAASPDDLDRASPDEADADGLPIPDQEIYDGYNTNRLVIHQYTHWRDLYGPRQLLALGKLLRAIAEEPEPDLRDALLGAFQSMLDTCSNITSYDVSTNKSRGATAGHDFRNPTTALEIPIWGTGHGRGPFTNTYGKVLDGLAYRHTPDVTHLDGNIEVRDALPKGWKTHLVRLPAARCSPSRPYDLIITDPPYAGSVQYAEMSDWPYVWLHHVLKDVYPDEFGTPLTRKAEEIIENGAEKDATFFFAELTKAWRACHAALKDEGLLVFTFHHKEGDRWTGLLRSLFDAGFYLIAAYPTHSEALNSIVIQATKGITYDIIHVCRKRLEDPAPIPWTRLRRQVQKEAQQQLAELEASGDVLPGPDVWMILLGKALKLFSQHYGKVIDADGSVLDLDEAMERIRVLVREVRGETIPLPGALQAVDGLSQVALLHVVGGNGWTRDGLHIELRGYAHSTDDLVGAGLIEEVHAGRLAPVAPLTRAGSGALDISSGGPLIDKVHHTLGTLDDGRPLDDVLVYWHGHLEPLAEALTYLASNNSSVRDLAHLAVREIEAYQAEHTTTAPQLGLFGDGEER